MHLRFTSLHPTSLAKVPHRIMGGKVIEVTSSSEWSKRLADASSSKKAVRVVMVVCLLRNNAWHNRTMQPLPSAAGLGRFHRDLVWAM